MDVEGGNKSNCSRMLTFIPLFILLCIIGVVKVLIFGPCIFFVVLVGNLALIYGLFPVHVIWTCYCIIRTKKFGELLKAITLILFLCIAVLWLPASTIGSISTGLVFGFTVPFMGTFYAYREEVPNKLERSFKDGAFNAVKVACMIVRDFKDMCVHSYFSVMDGLLEASGETIMDIRLVQVPGCILAAIIGVIVNFPMFYLIVIYKFPVMLYKGWRQLIRDLIGRTGPFTETVCVPFAPIMILLWPIVVMLAAVAGIFSCIGFGLYSAVVACQENSTKSGIKYAFAAASIFDEATNDFLYMREGSCFPRPTYRKEDLSRSDSFPIKRTPELAPSTSLNHPLIKTPSMKLQELKAVVIWENLLMACTDFGKKLVKDGAIWISDLEAWQHSKNKIVNIGLPSYVLVQCFIRSIKSGSSGFVMQDNVELTSINRPEGRIFDWLYEPMILLKEQIRAMNLSEAEEAFLCKFTLFSGDTQRCTAWQNGGVPPTDEVRRAQLEGLSRRLLGFSLTLSRMPTFRRRFEEVVKTLLQEAKQMGEHNADNANIA